MSPSPRPAKAFGLPGLVVESECRLWENKVLSRLKQENAWTIPYQFQERNHESVSTLDFAASNDDRVPAQVLSINVDSSPITSLLLSPYDPHQLRSSYVGLQENVTRIWPISAGRGVPALLV